MQGNAGLAAMTDPAALESNPHTGLRCPARACIAAMWPPRGVVLRDSIVEWL